MPTLSLVMISCDVNILLVRPRAISLGACWRPQYHLFLHWRQLCLISTSSVIATSATPLQQALGSFLCLDFLTSCGKSRILHTGIDNVVCSNQLRMTLSARNALSVIIGTVKGTSACDILAPKLKWIQFSRGISRAVH